MSLELVDSSDIKDEKEKKDDKKDGNFKKEESKKKGLKILPKGDVVSCERVKKGITNNCALCEITNNDVFVRCPNKWKF